ncbi:MAG TPA: DUF1761 domain-containing protein [Candidatus Nanoarchaeia archaeon]|nr:DUF1761 domain-containing protein [Candidatus Nanoarchaeia archaeon]
MAVEVVINYWAVLVATIAAQVIGFLWYGPLFGKLWIKLSGFTDLDMAKAREKGMAKSYILNFIASLVTAYVLAHFVDYVGAASFGTALQLAFWLWLGFIVPVMLGIVIWEGKPARLYILNIVHYLISLVVMSVILALWI